MKQLSQAAWSLWGKKGKPGQLTWLPLPQHLMDTAQVARKLWQHWLSQHARNLIIREVGSEEKALGLLMFLCFSHDIAKACPGFFAKPRAFIPDDLDQLLMDLLRSAGLPCLPWHEFSAAKLPHALMSQQLLLQAGCHEDLASLIGAHHGKTASADELGKSRPLSFPRHYHLEEAGKALWRQVQQEFLDFALRQSGFASIQALPVPNVPILLILCGLLIMADWIASNERLFPYLTWGEDPKSLMTEDRINHAWDKLALMKGWQFDDFLDTPLYYQDRFNIPTPYPAQQAALDCALSTSQPGIFILEAPMGNGKTEAALAVAEVFASLGKRTGLLFALPTQATSNAMFQRVLNWTQALDWQSDDKKEYTIRLAHGKAQFQEEYYTLLEGSRHIGDDKGDSLVNQWFEGNKKALLADFVVGTIDQFLMAALRQKHVMLRLLGLADKVVVLDESHAYDTYMNGYLDTALSWMGALQVSVIILSATLPAARRTQLVQAYLGQKSKRAVTHKPRGFGRANAPIACAPDWTTSRGYPLITWTDGSEVRQHTVEDNSPNKKVLLERLADEQLVSTLKKRLAHGGYAGVMVNTVKRAQQFAQLLEDAFGEKWVTLIHAQFLAPHRAKIEEGIVKMLAKPKDGEERKGTHIVVGTQVLEQSLDLDFDILVSDLCPMDLLLQRMGRLHRHERSRPKGLKQAACLVLGALGEDFEPGAKAVYQSYPLIRTLALLPQDFLILPKDIPALVQDVYDPDVELPYTPNGYEEAKTTWLREIAQKESRASSYQIKEPRFSDELTGWMDNLPGDAQGEASVRDGADSLEVFVICETAGGGYTTLMEADKPLAAGGLYAHRVPDKETARHLARQSLRLPARFCYPDRIKQTIDELESTNTPLSPWQQSPWLKGSLFLILDHQHRATLCGIPLAYSQKHGLMIEE